jgi:hypothetical protein
VSSDVQHRRHDELTHFTLVTGESAQQRPGGAYAHTSGPDDESAQGVGQQGAAGPPVTKVGGHASAGQGRGRSHGLTIRDRTLNADAGRAAQERRRSPRAKFEDAIRAEDWEGLAQLLSDITPTEGDALPWLLTHPWMLGVLPELTADQLRYLDDETRRLGLDVAFPRQVIREAMAAQGVFDDQTEPGKGYGEVTVEKDFVLKQGMRDEHNFRYWFQATFMPGGATNAEEIAFVQTVRAVDSDTGANISPYGEVRMADDATKVDCMNGKKHGWYGMSNDGTRSMIFRPWVRGARAPAFMRGPAERAPAEFRLVLRDVSGLSQGRRCRHRLRRYRLGFHR